LLMHPSGALAYNEKQPGLSDRAGCFSSWVRGFYNPQVLTGEAHS
jgi:hypothetical protein